MVIKNGKHRLVGFVDLGSIHDDMKVLSGKLVLLFLDYLDYHYQ